MGENLNEPINKLFEEIEADADEMIKSAKAKKLEKGEEGDEDIKPSDVADVDDTGNEGEDEKEDSKKEEKEEKEPPKKEEKEPPKKEEGEGEEKEDNEEDDNEEDEGEEKEDNEEDDNEEDEDKKEVEKAKKSFDDLEDLITEYTLSNVQMMENLHYDIEKSMAIIEQKEYTQSEQFDYILKSQNELIDLVKSQAETISKLETRIGELENAQSLAKSQKVEELENRQEDIIKSLESRIDELEHRPIGRKAQVDVFEKSFNQSAGISEPKKQLSKAQVLDKMTNMLMSGTPGITVEDVISYESTGNMSKSVKDLVLNS